MLDKIYLDHAVGESMNDREKRLKAAERRRLSLNLNYKSVFFVGMPVNLANVLICVLNHRFFVLYR